MSKHPLSPPVVVVVTGSVVVIGLVAVVVVVIFFVVFGVVVVVVVVVVVTGSVVVIGLVAVVVVVVIFFVVFAVVVVVVVVAGTVVLSGFSTTVQTTLLHPGKPPVGRHSHRYTINWVTFTYVVITKIFLKVMAEVQSTSWYPLCRNVVIILAI